jgi:hypothetical protein
VFVPMSVFSTCMHVGFFQLYVHDFYSTWNTYPTVTSARSCNNVGHLFWFTILAQHDTNNVILYIHSVHKHRGNTFQCQNYKMRLKQRSLNWINSKYFRIQFAWPTFQKRSWTVMSIMSTNRKNTNVWGIQCTMDGNIFNKHKGTTI